VIWFFLKNIYITFGVLNRFSFPSSFTHSVPHYRFNALSLRTTLTGSTYHAFSGATYATNASMSFTL